MNPVEELLAKNRAAERRFGKKGNKPEPLPQKRAHMKVYRDRKAAGLKPLPKPWDYLCSAEVKAMAWQAYRAASWDLREDMFEGRIAHQDLRERFAELLAEMFKDALAAHAVTEGSCWPVEPDTPPYRNYPRIWQMLVEGVPDTWRPEYPVYQEVTPASATNASGVVTTADEGNGNARDSSP